ncbi:MAG: hypothetical protein K6F34_06690 [Lachnospiraceae bacterium]|nr:hypothetical protein [Lachnospiraceae bacterium]
MRYLVFLAAAAAAGILIRIKSEYRGRILAFLGILTAFGSIVYNIRMLDSLMPSFRPVNQTFYQPSYAEEGEYPDALLAILFKDRNVYVKNDRCGEHGYGERYWLYKHYHAANMQWFLSAVDANVIPDDELNDINIAEELALNDFSELGRANDMFRYIFMYNDLKEEWGNYFYYYWYYYEHLDTIKVYLEADGPGGSVPVFEPGDLVVMWNTVDGVEEEDIYIMTRDYFEKNIGPLLPEAEASAVDGTGREAAYE